MEVAAVQERQRSKGDGQVPLGDAELVHAARVEGQLEPIDPRCDLVGHGGAQSTEVLPFSRAGL